MSPKRKGLPKQKKSHVSTRILQIGLSFIGIGLLLLFAIFLPVLTHEMTYRFGSLLQPTTNTSQEIPPIDEEFGIVIPKIHANARVIPNVDPYNQTVYQQALTKGVAHAKGSVFPGRVGNVFIFSHSSVNFFEALRYNSVFYLLDKLEPNDTIIMYMDKEKFTYLVAEKKLIEPTNTYYLLEKTDQKLLTLMTCWPPGTTYKRLIIRAILQEP